MRTLDEVIIGIKEQMGLGDPILIDALHYLEEYKERETKIIDRFIELHQEGIRKLINTEAIIAVIDTADDRYKSAILIPGSTIPRGFDETYDEIKSLMESMSNRSI